MDQHLKKIESIFKEKGIMKRYRKGELILSSYETVTDLFFLKEGAVKIYSLQANGNEITMGLINYQFIFPLASIFLDKINSFFFQALTDSIVYKIPQNLFQKLLKEDCNFLLAIAKNVNICFINHLKITEQLLYGSAEMKICATLLYLVSRSTTNRSNKNIILQYRLPHREIASLTGLTRETVTKELGYLRKKRLLSYKEHYLVINNIKELEDYFDLSQK